MQAANQAPKYSLSAQEICDKLKARLVGRADLHINNISSMEDALEDSLVFIKEKSADKISRMISASRAMVFIINENSKFNSAPENKSLIFVKDPLSAIVKLIPFFFPESKQERGINPKADIHPSVRIGKNVSIGAFSSIGENCILEDDVTIYPHVVIYPRVTIGRGTQLHAGCVIREDCIIGANNIIQNGSIVGADGFGYFLAEDMSLKKVPQVGNVTLAEHVELGANSCIDRATLGSTSVGANTKIDNLVQIGHNVKIGQASIICGLTGIAGSSKIGSRVTLGGQVGVKDHTEIKDDVRVAAKSGVVEILQSGYDYAGMPAVRASEWRRSAQSLAKLPEVLKKLRTTLKDNV